MIHIAKLYIYPVKSLAGIEVKHAKLTQFGLENDRRYVIVDENHNFLTQRTVPKMVTIKTTLHGNQITLSHHNSTVKIPTTKYSEENKTITLWKDHVQAQHVSTTVDKWLSNYLNKSCKMYYMPVTTQRQVDTDFAAIGQCVSFADAFPLLLTSIASHEALNKRMGESIAIERFRPNMVISGTTPFAEDELTTFKINALTFHAVKKCSRCIVPSINPQNGSIDKKNILVELNKFRKINGKIMFGQNLIFDDLCDKNKNILNCGDKLNA